jgi:hypothetical protein
LPFNETVYSQDEDDRPSGAFLGEIPPGLEPKVFSSDFLSKDNVVGFTISPDGEEIYYCRFIANNPKIFYTEKIQGQWIFPQQSRFNEDYFGGPPHISPNGKKIYWRSNRPFPEDWPGPRPQPRTREATQYWVSERSENGWNNPRPLQLPISLETNLLGMSTTRDETIYTSISFQIIRIRKNNGSYERVEKLPGFLNGHSPAIAPDESFLIFVQGTPRQLYVSFRDKNDSWTKPQSLGSEINMKRMNGYPSVTPDSRYLFYTVDHKLYWVNTDIIKQLQIAK